MADETAISEFRPFIRTAIGDNHPVITQVRAEQIDDAVKLTVNLGKCPGLSLSEDGTKITPAVMPSDPVQAKNWARIVLYSAKLFINLDAASSAYRFRAMSESFGEKRELVFSILAEVYTLEFGEGGE